MNLSKLMRYEEHLDRLERRRRILKVPMSRLKDRSNPLEDMDEVQFLQRFHLRKSTMLFVLNLIKHDMNIWIRRGSPLPPILELCVAVRFYATDSFQLVIADLFRVNQSTVSRIVMRVSKAMARRAQDFIKYPTFNEAIKKRAEFHAEYGFPGVVGCIDCTHVPVQSPGGPNAELFRNRKGCFSINVQAICDAKLVFTDVVVRWYGSFHDSRIFDNSLIKDRLINNEVPGILLGDGGYSCTHYLMTPLLTTQTPQEKRYNAAQIRTRNCIERAFGVWKRRFPCLNFLRVKVGNALVVITAVAVLHNICRKRSDLFHEETDNDADIGFRHTPAQANTAVPSTVSGRAARAVLITSKF